MDNLNTPLITVGIPFFNSEKYLADAIKSVLNQTYTNLEIILVDDGSTDASLDIAKAFEANHARITVIKDGNNLGLPKRLNQLSKAAKGMYYARMDADDIMFPNRLEEQVTYLQNHPEVDLLSTGQIAIDNANSIIGLRKGNASSKITFKSVLKGPWAAHPSITGKSIWFKNNSYDENLKRSQDFELWIRTINHSKFVRLETPLLFYREASTSSIKKYLKSTKYAMLTFWKHRKSTGIGFFIANSLKKLAKLFAYFLCFVFGTTNKLIEKRSVKLTKDETNTYLAILNKALL